MSNIEIQTPTNRKPLILWLYTGCFLVFAMVIIGGITRLTGSGLSITEWNVVTGSLPPLSDAQWQEEFQKYQQIPQFKELNYNFTLHDFKNIYWWEYLHRLLGRLMGFAFIIPFIYFLIKKQIDKKLLPKLLLIFGLGAWQGFLGWYMVKSGLVNNTHVSHYRLAIHLMNAFITFGYIFWVAMDLKYESESSKNNVSKGAKHFIMLTYLILLIQIIYGAFVAGLHAGFMYNTWPKMGDSWIAPDVAESLSQLGFMSFIDNPLSVQFIHRTMALIVLAAVSFMWFKRKSVKWSLNNQQIQGINFVSIIVLIQVILGILTLLFIVPVWLGVTHQAVAFLIFASMLYLTHRLYRNKN